MKKLILVVMAAGMGSRYGGLKQLDSIGQSGQLIIDYSIYDAMKAGFGKVVFIIKESMEEDFREVIGNRLNDFIQVDYAFQELKDIPSDIVLPKDRKKPLGTAHAVYAARNKIDKPFCVINADDYYGADAFESMHCFLTKENLGAYEYAMVGYNLGNTVTDKGYVSRGICDIDDGMMLQGVTERTHIEKTTNGIMYSDKNNDMHIIDSKTIVSMNLWGFTTTIIDEIKQNIGNFLLKALKENPLKCEYFLPAVVDGMIKDNRCTVNVMHTDEKWYGVTYYEDKAKVVDAIAKMIEQGKYPEKLWEK